MTFCFFFARGKEFNVDSFLDSSTWSGQASTFHQGEESAIKGRPPESDSGFNMDISSSDDNDTLQIQGVIAFLKKNSSELQRLKAFPGVEEIELRFGFSWYSDTYCKMVSLPPELSQLAGKYNIEVTISMNATSDERSC